MRFYEINICQVMILKLYTVYNKHEMKNWQSIKRKIPSITASAQKILLLTVNFV